MALFSKQSNHNEDLYKVIYNTYKHDVYYILIKITEERSDALNIMQNVFINVWKYRQHLNTENTIPIIVNSCKEELKRFYKTVSEIQFRPLYTEDASGSDQNIEHKGDFFTEMERLIEELHPPIRREIFRMNKVEGISEKQIATHFQLSEQSVKTHILQSLCFIKKRLDES